MVATPPMSASAIAAMADGERKPLERAKRPRTMVPHFKQAKESGSTGARQDGQY